MGEVKLPIQYLQRMRELLGDEYQDFLESYGRQRVYGLRVNTLKTDSGDFCGNAPFALSPVEWCSAGFYFDPESRPGRHPYHEAGVYYIQEPSAMAAAELLMPNPGERVLDLCAAPGGKTTHIAAKMQNTGLLLANEIHPQRAKILSQNVERMGLKNTVVTNETPERLAGRFPGFFDRILVDAPCSGEGMFRKDENAPAEWSPENVQRCAARQRDILEYADQMLRPGGCMVYSTCTFSPEEDEGVMEDFTGRHEEYLPLVRHVPECFVRCRIPGAYRLYPHRLKGEGHFLAVLEKGEKGRGRVLPAMKPFRDKSVLADFEEWKKNLSLHIEGDNYLLFGDQLYLVPEGMTDIRGIRIERPGLHMGTFLKKRFEPSHALAMALRKEEIGNTVSFSADSSNIRAYLSGESIPLPDSAGMSRAGWHLVLVDGYPAGWGKVNHGMLKNHYPKGLRADFTAKRE